MKNVLYWALAILITLSAVTYQRMTGPTNPKRVKFELSGKEYSTKLSRSLNTSISIEEAKGDYQALGKTEKMEFEIPGSSDSLMATLYYHRYPLNDTVRTSIAEKSGDKYSVILPSQPPAAKIAYMVEFSDGSNSTIVGLDENIILRFKNPVPGWVLVPHILLMFIAMLLSTYVGVLAFTKSDKTGRYAIMVLIALGIGGFILGPIVQKYAFGAYWTGWPFGGDLTDNKTLVAFAFWLFAWFRNRKVDKKWWYAAAAIAMLLIYSIPHSTAGSEYNFEKNTIQTGR